MLPPSSLKENFYERIRNRFTVGRADAMIAMLKTTPANRGVGQGAVESAASLVERCRAQAREAISRYREWQAAPAVHELLQPLSDQEGRILLTHARAMCSLYLDAHREHRDLARMAAHSVANACPANPD
jgi:hypothetical protein